MFYEMTHFENFLTSLVSITYCFSEEFLSRWFIGIKLRKLQDKSKGLNIAPAVQSFKQLGESASADRDKIWTLYRKWWR